jgi:anti-sigma B factor antagonist
MDPQNRPDRGGKRVQGESREILTVQVEASDGASIVRVSGELDLSTVPRLEEALGEQVEQRSAVLIDLTDLKFIDSSGIGALMKAKKIVDGAPISVLIDEGSQVERIFAVAGVAQALPVFSSRGAAMASLAADGDAKVQTAD